MADDPELEKAMASLREEFGFGKSWLPGSNDHHDDVERLLRCIAALRHQINTLQFDYDQEESRVKGRIVSILEKFPELALIRRPWSTIVRMIEAVRRA